MRESRILGLLLALAFCGVFAIVWQQWDRVFHGANDFIAMYSGSKLAATGDLYDPDRLHEVSRHFTGMSSDQQGYVRLPFHAALLWPLSRLPYLPAYYLWQAAAIAAIAGFVVLWRPPAPPITLFYTCLSIPTLHAWLKGQDVPFLLLWLALTVRLHCSGREFAAGVIYSLCAMKFHLFLLTPVLILGQRAWKFGKGLLAGGAGLLVISFAAGGWGWPLEFLASAMNPTFSPGIPAMPNLHGAVSQLPLSPLWEVLLGVTVVIATWEVARRTTFSIALACSLAGGLLLSYHAYMLDMAILLPAALAVLVWTQSNVLRVLGVTLLTPPAHFAVGVGYPYSAVAVGLVVVFVCAIAFEARRGRGGASRIA